MTRQRLQATAKALTSLVLAIAMLVGPLGAVGVAAASANSVTWTIDDNAKTITAQVRLTLTPACTANQMAANAFNPLMASRCTVTPAMADEIRANIEKIWNGHKYYCYDIVVKVDVKIDNSPTAADPTDRLRVQVDQSPATIRSFVTVTTSAGATWNGNAPGDQLHGENRGTASSAWAYPPGAYGPNLYAHEAGHVLGIDDTYEDVPGSNPPASRPRPGAPIDIMNSTGTDHVDRVTANRLAERAGARKSALKCNYKIDQPSMGGRIKGLKCDPLGGQWVAQGTYSIMGADGQQEWIMTMNEVTKRGNFVYSDHQVAEFALGIKVYTDGAAVGQVTLTIDDELKARFHLVEQVHTYKSTTSAGGSGGDQNAPLTQTDMIWEPIGRCP